MKQLFVLLSALALFSFGLQAQIQKPSLDFSVYDGWKSINQPSISRDGNWVAYEINPSEGDGNLYLQNWDNGVITSIPRGDGATIDPTSNYMVFKIKPQADTVRQAKLKKVKSDKMPKDTLGIFLFKSHSMKKYARLKSFRLAKEFSPWLAYQLEEVEKVEAKKDSTNNQEKKGEGAAKDGKKAKPKKKEYKGSDLVVLNPVTGDSVIFHDITEFSFSDDGKWLTMVGIEEDSVNTSTVRIFDTKTGKDRVIYQQEGVVKSLISDDHSQHVAFFFTSDTTKTKIYDLYHWSVKSKEPQCLVTESTEGMNDDWCVSQKRRPNFSENGERIFFGVGPKPEPVDENKKDSILNDEKVFIDIWNWRDVVVQSMQLKRVGREKNKNYQAVYHLKKKHFVVLERPDFLENIRVGNKGNDDFTIVTSEQPYEWDNAVNFTNNQDVYRMDILTGDYEKIFQDVSYRPQLSPQGKYIYWWEAADSCWYSYSIKEKNLVNLTRGLPVGFVNDIHDTPSAPGSYGTLGWTKDDGDLFIYDKYDIWRVDPEGKKDAVNVTLGMGAKNHLRFRYTTFDRDEKFIDPAKKNLFTVFNTDNKKSGFYYITLQSSDMQEITIDACKFGRTSKAEDANRLMWTRSSITEYPDLWLSDIDFSHARKITHANPQQDSYNWATVELVEWMDFEGEEHQGLLYKPEDFDPSKKYPMMVYFYERLSDGLYNYISPRASYSTINTVFYASNGYLVFQPDISYRIGLPGKSSYDAIVSGVMKLCERPYVDSKHMGLQGQSWGGYATAYLITQTDLFAAASPGAPVSNMTSAYGGIRLASGMIRQVQYEKGQSRIGGTLWDKFDEYYENSPLFYADRVNTPCLIRHNDTDGAVPFEQGVEFFVGLRRLGKPAWLLNYNHDGHNLTTKLSNRKDLSVRMKQFFDHYLKGAPAPTWMTEGVKAVDKKDNETYYMQFMKK